MSMMLSSSVFGLLQARWGGRVIWAGGIAPTIMAGTHGYGFGCILVYEDNSDKH